MDITTAKSLCCEDWEMAFSPSSPILSWERMRQNPLRNKITPSEWPSLCFHFFLGDLDITYILSICHYFFLYDSCLEADTQTFLLFWVRDYFLENYRVLDWVITRSKSSSHLLSTKWLQCSHNWEISGLNYKEILETNSLSWITFNKTKAL